MKKSVLSFVLAVLILALPLGVAAQTFDGEWICNYATIDDQPNATGNRTISVASYGEDDFVALVADFADNDYYMVGYLDADSVNGRLGDYQYSGTDQLTGWVNGFDQTFFNEAKDLEHFKSGDDNLIFVANNDNDKNILVFKMTADSFETHPWRMSTIQNAFDVKDIWAIDIDAAGRVYVTTADSSTPSEIYVFDSPENESAWSSGHAAAPLQIITLPDAGEARGVTVNPEGTVIYVSNYVTKNVYCYVGDPVNGYTLYDGFDFSINEDVTDGTNTYTAGPWGLNFMPGNNILFVCSALDYQNNTLGYSYGRVYLVNPNNGEIMDTLDNAQWNFDQTGSYNNLSPGNVSAYASPYNCDFDENGNVYCVSYYGWSIDKWTFTGTLPTIELTIVTDVEETSIVIPEQFSLQQNYPNPFNPSTTIKFDLNESDNISLEVYSITGELVSKLIDNKFINAGSYSINFDASSLSSGVYLYRLKNSTQVISKKMTLTK